MVISRHKSYALLKLRLPRRPEQGDKVITLELQLVGDARDRALSLPKSLVDWQLDGSRTDQSDPSESVDLGGTPRVSIGRWRVPASDVGLPFDPKFVDFSWNQLLPPLVGPIVHLMSGLLSYFRENLGDGFSDSLSQVALPTRVARSLKTVLYGVLGDREPLWLQIAQPSGNLSIIPWESMLQENLERPILRLSPLALAPLSSRGMQEVVMCISSPGTVVPARRLRELVLAVSEELPSGSRLHIFSDGQHFPGLKQTLPTRALETSLILYDPAQSPSPSSQPAEANEYDPETKRRWTKWMRTELGGIGVDMFHFIVPASRFLGSPRLRFAREPQSKGSDKSTTRLVSSQELGDFLTGLGAWSVVFSSPFHRSRFGIQLFADQLAALRPGPLAVHDAENDQGNMALRQVYRFLLRSADEPPRGQAISLYYHPSWLGTETVIFKDAELRGAYNRARERCRSIVDLPGPAPSWVTSRQRFLEEVVSGYMDREPQSDLESAALRGLRRALDDLSESLPSVSESPAKERN